MILTYCIVLCRALQARVSRQVIMNKEEDDSDDEPKQPERISLADLKHRGKKKAIAPINRAGPAIKSNHLNIQINLLQFLKDDTSSSPAASSCPRSHLNEFLMGSVNRFYWRPAVTWRSSPRQRFKQSLCGFR